MHVVVLGAGLMGRAIAFDLCKNTSFDTVTLCDENSNCLTDAKKLFLDTDSIHFEQINVVNEEKINSVFERADVVISAIPYMFNEQLTQTAIAQRCHFVDLGGNNSVVQKQKELHSLAKDAQVTVIPDSGLAPGLVSILTKSLVDEYGHLDKVSLRVGGLPQKPKVPWNYQLVFSANGLINEYVEDAIVLDHGQIKTIPSLTERESIVFPQPFGKMEAFTTSGGCSTLPFTYKNDIDYLDYKTIRYPGHLQQIKPLFDLGLDCLEQIQVRNKMIAPRNVFIELLKRKLPSEGKDVVLLRVTGDVSKDGKKQSVSYQLIDYYDDDTTLSAMMRTTGFPVSITADLLATNEISKNGVFTPEEIIPTTEFLKELQKRNVVVTKTVDTD